MHIKRVELSHFKSFGGTARVPLLPGFTVISGPNGSGKSNILDGLLFALGLSGSKGMRAERLPDLVNHNQTTNKGRATVEASVTVTFDLEDYFEPAPEESPLAEEPAETELEPELEPEPEQGEGNALISEPIPEVRRTSSPNLSGLTEWSVTRKLRVTQQGTYTSNYYINSQPCTLNELHEQLHRLRIYPEGYNVVLQGDVTSIISMNPRERREIIDELAGVAAFDRKIIQAKDKLNAVKEREERFQIVEKELIVQRDRLAQDRVKAEKYQKLRQELQTKSQWEAVLTWRNQQRQAQKLQRQIETDDLTAADLVEQVATIATELQQLNRELQDLADRVKILGEEEQLALQSTLATQEAELRQLQRQEQDLLKAGQEAANQLARTQQEIQEHLRHLETVALEQQTGTTRELPGLQAAWEEARQALEQSREAANAIASASEAWVQQQTALHHQIDTLLRTLTPHQTEQAQLQERATQLERQMLDQGDLLQTLDQDLEAHQAQEGDIMLVKQHLMERVHSLAQAVASTEQQLQIQQETRDRLLQEQREKQRRLDRLEAQTQAMQESQGTQASRLILQMGIPGICGLVAQLGRVEPRYQLALETAAGARLGHLVVEDDGIASAAIELLKQKKAGRATFLPLNKIQAPRPLSLATWKRAEGLVDFALNLIECDDRYRDVFAFVFGNTIVFETLEAARRNLGQFRMVTLDGELLETSGAMTGGSVDTRYAIHFGKVAPAESAEVAELRDRLQEVDRILSRCETEISRLSVLAKQKTQELIEARQQLRETELQAERLQSEIGRLGQQQTQTGEQRARNNEELTTVRQRLDVLACELPLQEAELRQLRAALADLEQSQTHSEWQQAQAIVREREALLQGRDQALRKMEQHLQDLENQGQRLQEKLQQLQGRIEDYRGQQTAVLNQQTALSQQQSILQGEIAQTQTALAALEQTLGSARQDRDRAERQVRERTMAQQQLEWQAQKLGETQTARRTELAALLEQLQAQQGELPDPLPEIPETLGAEQLQQELRSLQKRLQAMEPVNMLALEEYDRTQTRLQELSQKLATLNEERTELLLRIENFTTLRQRAFREAFDAVNINFQAIFAELSDGDGHLQLDDPEDPFGSGLNLVAHPKGKPVQRLASMSGGEKSLTALSFIFALQRYRPSPFYAFDEVDMFLDGANVERLSRMIRRQSEQAQFIVVSLRRPMIESAERTIGVTQARGAYTQVLGIELQPRTASV
ncbi:chromosome segregation protein SMC [Leptolyngbya sp. 'hensonii']|uniref:chromosome segregation protein SMC n=1 Tax=Leptolyngbya sp. 'hensonii' TaxID=1922337 RepID=UPI00094FECDD|nr:chromosome segregation protein SMC [Leptolyngbya sp. 'hensonii']OLP17754.1 chromosome segregation protein SMC [Leptolyngbya sp. 'hensonii']